MSIIAFTGRKYSGKDTAAKIFIAAGFAHLKMAGPLKIMLAALMDEQGASDEVIERSIEGDLKEVPSIFLAGQSPRHAMQTLGTEWGRGLIAEDFWIQCFKNAAKLYPNVVVSDVRFPNEVKAIQGLGGQVFRIVRPSLMTANDNHPSEIMIDQLEVDGEFHNTAGSAREFQEQLMQLLRPSQTKVQ